MHPVRMFAPISADHCYRTYSYHWSYIHLVLTHARPEGLSDDRVFKLESVGAKENIDVCLES